jgi:hypothetical protein
MSNTKLAVLGIVAAVMVILLAVQSRMSKAPVKLTQAGSYLIQGLEPARIAGIVIGKGDEPLKLERRGGLFTVAGKEGYPASIKKINNLLASLLDIKIVDWVTDKAENYESLGVTEDDAQSVVRLLDGKGEPITGVLVGSSKLPDMDMGPGYRDTTYVRLVEGNAVYEVDSAPFIGSSATDYIEREILNVDDDDVKRVTVAGPNETYTLRVQDGNDGKIVLDRIPEGRELKESTARQVMSALSYLSLTDVKKASSFAEGELEFEYEYLSELNDSVVYSFRIATGEGKTYIKCSAGGSNKEKAGQLAQFNKLHRGWVYEIPQYKVDNLTRKMADLLEEQEKEQEKEPEAEPAPMAIGAEEPALKTEEAAGEIEETAPQAENASPEPSAENGAAEPR